MVSWTHLSFRYFPEEPQIRIVRDGEALAIFEDARSGRYWKGWVILIDTPNLFVVEWTGHPVADYYRMHLWVRS